MYYKVNEKEGKILKHIYNLYIRGYYCEEIATIFNKGDIIYGIHERIKYILSTIEEIIYGMPRKSGKKDLISVYETIIDEIDYIGVLKTKNKEEIDKVIIKNLDKYIEKLKKTNGASKRIETIIQHYSFIKEEIKKLYKEPAEIIESLPKNRKGNAPFGYEAVI